MGTTADMLIAGIETVDVGTCGGGVAALVVTDGFVTVVVNVGCVTTVDMVDCMVVLVMIVGCVTCVAVSACEMVLVSKCSLLRTCT
jgi:hypothetical protein